MYEHETSSKCVESFAILNLAQNLILPKMVHMTILHWHHNNTDIQPFN